MKIKYSSFVGLLAVLLLVASFVVPAKLASPASVDADPGLMEWTIVDTPDSQPGLTDSLYTEFNGAFPEDGSELIKLLVGNDGNRMVVQVARGDRMAAGTAGVVFLTSRNGGRSWSLATYNNLDAVAGATPPPTDILIWDMAMAPDDPNVIAMAISDVTVAPQTQQVWISTDFGANWQNTQWPPVGGTIVAGVDFISTMDISKEFGSRELLVGTRDGTGLGTDNIQVLQIPSFGGWNQQDGAGAPVSINQFTGDVIVAKFSPTYDGDSTIAAVYTDATAGHVGTWLLTGVHDIAQNFTTWQATGAHVEIMNPTSTTGQSALINEIITADLEMPDDFSGQSASLRRFYISIDALSLRAGPLPNMGIYRVDDNIVYTLMDNTSTFALAAANTANRRIASIAYYGTYASGKLLAGERLGDSCDAAVPVWFTDSPTVCPIPCWYPAKKPPTGAAGQLVCNANTQDYGNAMVVWSPTFGGQGVAYAVTGASSFDGAFAVPAYPAAAVTWPAAIFAIAPLDESAFSLTRNNGETWNQLSLIDTRMAKLTDVAPSADCSTVYLASINNGTECQGFDSVWRTSINENVVAPPLPALPIGQVWERVRTSHTALSCNATLNPESNYAILRLAPDKLDGQIVFWAAGGVSGLANIGGFTNAMGLGANTRAVAWSPDFGDYWADITPRIAVQDMDAESSTILYILDIAGNVQKMPYTGTAWSSAIQTVTTGPTGHTIRAQAEGKVLTGATGAINPFPAWISLNGGASFIPMTRIPRNVPPAVGYHVLFDTDYDDNETIYLGNDNAAGLVWRNKAPSGSNAEWTDMMTGALGYTGHTSYFGLAQSNSKTVTGQGTLYAAHSAAGGVGAGSWCGVERTLIPLGGIPKPGLIWDCMDAAATLFRIQAAVVDFTLEPRSLKICGCLTQDTDSTLYAIDNDFYANEQNQIMGFDGVINVRDRGMLWAYTDCMAKKAPTLTMDDGTIIGCDPATGRAQEVNFTWEQLCIATQYEIQIAKDDKFTTRVFQNGPFRPSSVTSPAGVYGTGGVWFYGAQAAATGPALECGHTYFWRIWVLDETTGDFVRSWWSTPRSFTIKAGFRVTTPYYGPQLLAPDNGCGCPCDAPICFSWSPFKETTAYDFELSENFDMSSPLVKTTVKGATAYQYDGQVKCNTNYFWRVKAAEPAPSEWSAVFSFMTQAEEPPPPEPTPVPEEVTPLWVWVIIAIGAVLVIVTLVLIFKTRRV